MAKHRAIEVPDDYPVEEKTLDAATDPALSPVSGSLFITVAEVRYNGEHSTGEYHEWRPILFPAMNETDAQRMADYLDAYVAPEGTGFAPEYRNIRVAHCQYSEIPELTPEYNDTDPLS